MHNTLKMTKGLDIPMSGSPTGLVQELYSHGHQVRPKKIALNLEPFLYTKFKLLVKEGDTVKIGQPLAINKAHEKMHFVSPAAGKIIEIRRGLKRRLTDIVIELDSHEEWIEHPCIDVHHASRGILIAHLLHSGLFSFIRKRPFNHMADPTQTPRSIFVKAIETAPLAAPSELHVEKKEKEFQLGLDLLAKLTDGPVHLCYSADSNCEAFNKATNVTHHRVKGMHPAGTLSVLIHHIDPILESDIIIWTLNARTVVAIGHLLLKGRYYIDQIVALGGPGIIESMNGFFHLREGFPVADLVENRLQEDEMRLISGNPLTGERVSSNDFLFFDHDTLSVIPENHQRQFLHFFRPGSDKFTASRTYLSSFLNPSKKYAFTTSQHGEHRGFITTTLYDKVMPMNIPVMALIKALMAEDYELAEELGLLEVVPEDFALPAFVCPSKISMLDIVQRGQESYANDVLGYTQVS